jgi:regulator of protease activity HflC (stomatin/prohibitin superfamily)
MIMLHFLRSVKMIYVAIFVVPLIAMLIFASVKMIPQYERGVVFRMGKVLEPKGPGMVIVIPLVDKLKRVDMMTIIHDVPGQDIITKDNVSVQLFIFGLSML